MFIACHVVINYKIQYIKTIFKYYKKSETYVEVFEENLFKINMFCSIWWCENLNYSCLETNIYIRNAKAIAHVATYSVILFCLISMMETFLLRNVGVSIYKKLMDLKMVIHLFFINW